VPDESIISGVVVRPPCRFESRLLHLQSQPTVASHLHSDSVTAATQRTGVGGDERQELKQTVFQSATASSSSAAHWIMRDITVRFPLAVTDPIAYARHKTLVSTLKQVLSATSASLPSSASASAASLSAPSASSPQLPAVRVILDVAHNQSAVAALVAVLKQHFPGCVPLVIHVVLHLLILSDHHAIACAQRYAPFCDGLLQG